MPLTFEAEEIAPSHEENLYALLYELQIADRLPEFNDMFNSDVVLDHLVRSNLVTLQSLQSEYEEKFSSKCVEVDGVPCFHLSEFGFKRAPPRKLSRSFEKLPEVAFRECGNCPMHPQEHCKLLSYEYGFLCFLHMIPLPESSRSAETGTPWSIESEVSAGRDLVEEGGTIDEDQERIEAAQQSFPATSSLDVIDLNVESNNLDTLGNDLQRQSELALPHLPFFSMNDGFDYMLMSDVTHHLSIREDYCLAALAQFCEGDCEFVDGICDKYLLIDTNCQESKYEEGRAILRRIFNEAKSYERTVPSEEEFRATLHSLGLENMGKGSSVLGTSGGSSSSVPLWTPNMLENDENQLVYIEADEFLKRASGTRASMSSSSTLTYRKDAALKTYLKYLDPAKIKIFHRDFSNDGAKFPLFALKVLSRFCGGYDAPKNADKIVLIERQFAVRVFGQGLYCQALRAPYYIAYAAQALILGITEAEQLPVYGKRFLMRNRKLRLAPYMLPLPPPLLIEDVSGLQFEEDEPEKLEERAQKRKKPTSSPP